MTRTKSERDFDNRDVVKKRARAEFLSRVLYGLLALAVAIILVTIYFDVQVGRQQRDQIISCTTPQGDCFKDGQKRTAQVLKKINDQGLDREAGSRQIVIYASYCAVSTGSPDEKIVESCVRRLLAREGDTFVTKPKAR